MFHVRPNKAALGDFIELNLSTAPLLYEDHILRIGLYEDLCPLTQGNEKIAGNQEFPITL
jgi:hypothetical protein